MLYSVCVRERRPPEGVVGVVVTCNLFRGVVETWLGTVMVGTSLVSPRTEALRETPTMSLPPPRANVLVLIRVSIQLSNMST